MSNMYPVSGKQFLNYVLFKMSLSGSAAISVCAEKIRQDMKWLEI